MFFMWWVMMVAMMLPGAAPAILLFATVNRKQRDTGQPCIVTGIFFAFGYLDTFDTWAGFSLVAAILQRGVRARRYPVTDARRDFSICSLQTGHCRLQVVSGGTRWGDCISWSSRRNAPTS